MDYGKRDGAKLVAGTLSSRTLQKPIKKKKKKMIAAWASEFLPETLGQMPGYSEEIELTGFHHGWDDRECGERVTFTFPT